MHPLKWLAPLGSFVLACGSSAGDPKAPGPSAATAPKATDVAVAELFPVKKHEVRGIVRFRTTDDGVVIRGKLTGLSQGTFGFGIHENGDCSAHDGKLAGGYFNPKGDKDPLGNLGNLDADEKGEAELELTSKKLTMGGPESIVGRSLVIHAWAYDALANVKDVPFLACGVIQAE